jgi:hypothetical protein
MIAVAILIALPMFFTGGGFDAAAVRTSAELTRASCN